MPKYIAEIGAFPRDGSWFAVMYHPVTHEKMVSTIGFKTAEDALTFGRDQLGEMVRALGGKFTNEVLSGPVRKSFDQMNPPFEPGEN